ncbi:hypothetical protein [Rhizobium sp. NPDC090279]|uniref:hypothetical protein n=1 Tax=Rhizobium sp. NPDC090279 TaxID=3364499 RepID=UPI00383B82A5
MDISQIGAVILVNGDVNPDIEAIRALVERQFKSMSWMQGGMPDWAAFTVDFVPQAPLYASARPVQSQSVQQFVERMNGLVGTSLQSLDERVLGSVMHVFGNVAVAVVACESIENCAEVDRTVEMMLLVKNEGVWQIAAQAWDKENASHRVTARIWQGTGQTGTNT